MPGEEPTMSREVLTMPREELTMPMEEDVRSYTDPATTKEMVEEEGDYTDLAKPLLRVGLWQDLDWIKSNPNYIY